jgi:uncharacterized membrane protein
MVGIVAESKSPTDGFTTGRVNPMGIFKQFKLSTHLLTLGGLVLLGLVLRFWNLDSKPLWLDEILTALFGSGLSYDVIPTDQLIPIERLRELFRYQPATSCSEIAANLVRQSSHPPLFFCSLHHWLGWLSQLGTGFNSTFNFQLRSLPALLGALSIVLAYWLNRVAFGRQFGLLAAAIMAVSPFGVYLSQEARHYTLPICITLLALTCLVKLEQQLQKTGRFPLPLLGLWVIVNGVGLYVHYFFLYAFIAQAITLGLSLFWQRQLLTRLDSPQQLWLCRLWLSLIASTAIVAVLGIYTPGLITMFRLPDQANNQWLVFRPETLGDWIGPLLRQLIALITMVMAIPLEKQPTWLIVATLIPALLVFGLILIWTYQGLRQLCQSQQGSLRVLLIFTLLTFLANLGSAYLLRRDLTLGFRYSFTYFPGVIALVAAGLGQKYPHPRLWQRWLVVAAGCCGAILVVHNLAFLKPFSPERVSTKILNVVPIVQSRVQSQDQSREQSPRQSQPSSIIPKLSPILITMVYHSPMRVAVGLSYGLELARSSRPIPEMAFAFVDQHRTAPELLEKIHQQVKRFSSTQAKGTPFILWLSGSEEEGLPHILDSNIIAGLQAQGCQPKPESDFVANQGVGFHLYHCELKTGGTHEGL